VLDIAYAGQVHWVASSILRLELARNPDPQRRSDTLLLLDLAAEFVQPTPATFRRALALQREGYGAVDALHLTLAEEVGVTCLLTVDDSFLQRAARRPRNSAPAVENPVDWIRRRRPWLLIP
jgi:predicted nucleic acid-binding protein